MRSNRMKAAFIAGLLFLASCSQSSKPPAGDTSSTGSSTNEAAEPEAAVSGKTAFYEMYKSAYTWSKDITPLALESKTIPDKKNEGGNAWMWDAIFASPSKQEARTFTYAAIKAPPDIYKGVTVGRSITWTGPTKDAMNFQTSDLQVDSDAAYKTASEAAAGWLKKHPDKEASLTLGNAARFPAPVWYVLWGNKKDGYSVYVNSKTGAVIK